jgi:hypothetical protein
MLLLRELNIFALSKAVTNAFPKRATSKFILGHIQETDPSNVPIVGSVLQVSGTKETTSVDIIRTSKFDYQLYIYLLGLTNARTAKSATSEDIYLRHT